MAIYSFSCTRSDILSETSRKLELFFQECRIKHTFLVGASSIFTAYSNAVNQPHIKDNDIVILCHDDISIKSDRPEFLRYLAMAMKPNVGFIGVAGSKKLPEHGVWWNSPSMHLSGEVFHVKDGKKFKTHYGGCGKVEVMDGLFLAATKKTLMAVGLDRPEFLTENWDFYDIHYTYKANKLGYDNITVPIGVTHLSLGELAGRPQWFTNRKSFLESRMLY